MAADEPVRYRFGPLERRGIVAGWRGGQLATMAGALVLAVGILRARPTLPGVIGALVVVGLATAACTWPLGGRTAEEWAPDALRHARMSTLRRARHGAGPFAGLDVLRVTASGSMSAAVVRDVHARRYTCVLRATSSGFVLLGERDKEARVAAWSSLLASLAGQGGAVHRLQWVARSLPDDGRAARRYFSDAAVLAADSGPARSYGALLQAEASATNVHEVLVALTIDAGRSARAVRAAGGGDVGACAVLLREAAALRRLLADAGVTPGEVLAPEELTSAIRSGFDVDRPDGGGDGGARGGDGALPAAPGATPTTDALRAAGACWPWPMAVDATWDRARVDGTWHATYWVAEWPRRDVAPDFLGPLLVADVRRTASVVMEPMGAMEAARRVEQARTADIADAELRRRGGFLATARRRREEDVLVQREGELAEGHAHYRFAGYVTVTAASSEELDDACARTEQAAGRAGLELRRCYGDQDRAMACTLPLGRGLG